MWSLNCWGNRKSQVFNPHSAEKILLFWFFPMGPGQKTTGCLGTCCVQTLTCVRLFCYPMGCSPPGSSVHGILQARILEWVAISSSGNVPDPGIEPMLPAPPVLAGRFFTTEPPLGSPMPLWQLILYSAPHWHTLTWSSFFIITYPGTHLQLGNLSRSPMPKIWLCSISDLLLDLGKPLNCNNWICKGRNNTHVLPISIVVKPKWNHMSENNWKTMFIKLEDGKNYLSMLVSDSEF